MIGSSPKSEEEKYLQTIYTDYITFDWQLLRGNKYKKVIALKDLWL